MARYQTSWIQSLKDLTIWGSSKAPKGEMDRTLFSFPLNFMLVKSTGLAAWVMKFSSLRTGAAQEVAGQVSLT